jgi:dephospho-CoA kinase
MIFVLTGQIASGKSTISSFYSSIGVKVIDADKISKHVIDTDRKLQSDIINLLGKEAVVNDILNRKFVRDLIFSNENIYNDYCGLVNPYINKEINQQLKQIKEYEIGCFDIPLFFNTHWDGQYKTIIVVYCEKQTQINRMRLRGLDDKTIDKFISSQVPVDEQLSKATYKISSELSKEDMLRKASYILFNMRAELT